MTVKHVMPGNMIIETPFHVKGKVKDLTMATRWGCIGPGKIASDFFQAMVSNLSPADHQVSPNLFLHSTFCQFYFKFE